MKTAAVLLAAGQSTRFGDTDKLLANLHGRPLIAHAAQALRDLSPDHLIAVFSNPSIMAQLDGFTCISPGDAIASQSASLRCGVEHARHRGADRLIIALADMPFITATSMHAVLARCTDSCGSAVTDGQRRSPPACFPSRQFEALSKLEGDQGARALLQGLPLKALVRVDAIELADVDDRSDLERYA